MTAIFAAPRNMEALFGPRLQAVGVAVTPLSGAGRHAQIFDSDLLLRFTTAQLALMLDNLRESEVEPLMSNDAALEAALHSRKTELLAAASVVKNASRYERLPIPIFPHPARDIFDLLDPDVLTQEFPRFPLCQCSVSRFQHQ